MARQVYTRTLLELPSTSGVFRFGPPSGFRWAIRNVYAVWGETPLGLPILTYRGVSDQRILVIQASPTGILASSVEFEGRIVVDYPNLHSVELSDLGDVYIAGFQLALP